MMVAAAIHALSYVIAARLIVLVAVAGGIWLTWVATQYPDMGELIALGIYCGLVVIPCIWLAGRK